MGIGNDEDVRHLTYSQVGNQCIGSLQYSYQVDVKIDFHSPLFPPGWPCFLLQQDPVEVETCRLNDDDIPLWQYPIADPGLPVGADETGKLYEHKRMHFTRAHPKPAALTMTPMFKPVSLCTDLGWNNFRFY